MIVEIPSAKGLYRLDLSNDFPRNLSPRGIRFNFSNTFIGLSARGIPISDGGLTSMPAACGVPWALEPRIAGYSHREFRGRHMDLVFTTPNPDIAFYGLNLEYANQYDSEIFRGVSYRDAQILNKASNYSELFPSFRIIDRPGCTVREWLASHHADIHNAHATERNIKVLVSEAVPNNELLKVGAYRLPSGKYLTFSADPERVHDGFRLSGQPGDDFSHFGISNVALTAFGADWVCATFIVDDPDKASQLDPRIKSLLPGTMIASSYLEVHQRGGVHIDACALRSGLHVGGAECRAYLMDNGSLVVRSLRREAAYLASPSMRLPEFTLENPDVLVRVEAAGDGESCPIVVGTPERFAHDLIRRRDARKHGIDPEMMPAYAVYDINHGQVQDAKWIDPSDLEVASFAYRSIGTESATLTPDEIVSFRDAMRICDSGGQVVDSNAVHELMPWLGQLGCPIQESARAIVALAISNGEAVELPRSHRSVAIRLPVSLEAILRGEHKFRFVVEMARHVADHSAAAQCIEQLLAR